MLFNLISAMTAFSLLGAFVNASPILCPDSKRDLILRGTMAAEECCSYGVCKNTVVVAMGPAEESKSSAIMYNTR
ncbi:uncharacterized protein GGS22DRAFT_48391 [Annulohypoxylon maeteangense]|uniref:uncharacterized protein n=1 Tax=Annulohypoxylon maeteangense TaxID=1927788 RepID=UPI002008E93C|nr:uncharacterized protein GGS22DRAFT_48391 [Annulohypoxylon maeteangense]KAI0882149.1 hypothetical protein GGS22DRAFT_48391 [Annulohypoxylon maeteangense]